MVDRRFHGLPSRLWHGTYVRQLHRGCLQGRAATAVTTHRRPVLQVTILRYDAAARAIGGASRCFFRILNHLQLHVAAARHDRARAMARARARAYSVCAYEGFSYARTMQFSVGVLTAAGFEDSIMIAL